MTRKRPPPRRRAPPRRRRFGGITDSPRPENPHEAALVVTYWAISVLSSRVVWLNGLVFLVDALALTAIVTLVPPRLMTTYSAIIAMLNLLLRMITVRPVAFIPPGSAVPITVTRIAPPPVPLISD